MRSAALVAMLILMSHAALAQSLAQLAGEEEIPARDDQPIAEIGEPPMGALFPEPVETLAPVSEPPKAEACRTDAVITAMTEAGFQQTRQDLNYNDDPRAGDVIYFRKRAGERYPIDAAVRFSARPEIWGNAQGAPLRRIIVGQLNKTLGLQDGTQSLFRRRVTADPVSAVAEVYVPFGGRMGGTDVYLIITAPQGCATIVRLTMADGVHEPDQEQKLVDELFRAVLRAVVGDQEAEVKGVMWRRLVGHGPKAGEGAALLPDLMTPEDADAKAAPAGPEVIPGEEMPPVYVMPEDQDRQGGDSPYAPLPVPEDEIEGPAPPIRQAPSVPVENEPQFDEAPAVPALPDPGLPDPGLPESDEDVPVEDMIGLPMAPQPQPEPQSEPQPEPELEQTPLPQPPAEPEFDNRPIPLIPVEPQAVPQPKRTSTGLGSARRAPKLEVIDQQGNAKPTPALGGRRQGPRMEVLPPARPRSGAVLGERRTVPQSGSVQGSQSNISTESVLERGFDSD